jgi:hypothetical protein
MRKWLVFGAAIVVGAAIPMVAFASGVTGKGAAAINCQAVAWRTASVSTSSGAFTTVPGLQTAVTSIYPMTVTVSGVVNGPRVAFMVRDVSVAGNLGVPPGIIAVTAGSTGSPFSFTWTDPGTSAAIHGHQITVQWRRSAGTGPATLSDADISISYQTDTGTCPTSN